MKILEDLTKFLYKNFDPAKPVLLAYSGGTDSACLLDLLLKLKENFNINLHVAHVDHGWRDESKLEAELIKKQMKKLNIPYYFKKLCLKKDKNLENESRNERIKFFKILFEKQHFQAIILAHHKNDLAETVLKRFFEGAAIFSLFSMKEVSDLENMVVWRPLLNTSKKEINNYIFSNNINYFNDLTNFDTKYLRARMRKEILPDLERKFNKQIIENLALMASSSLELNNYLDKKTKNYLNNLIIGPMGICIDLNNVNELIELKYIIKRISSQEKIEVSRDVLNQVCFWILEKKANLKLKLKNADFCVDRGYFFILKKKYLPFDDAFSLNLRKYEVNSLEISVKKILRINRQKTFSWEDLFRGVSTIYVPEDKYFMGFLKENKKLKKNWENYKVPAFFRNMFPVIYDNNNNVYDFLSGKSINLNNLKILQIKLKLK